MYKLLALDMDGTLLNNRKVITKEVKEAISRLIERGVDVTFITGRFPASVWLHGKAVGLTSPLVALNGAVILDEKTGDPIKTSPLSADTAKKIADFADKNNVYVHYHGYNVLYVNQINKMNKKWAIGNVVVDETKELILDNYRDQLKHFSIREVGSLPEFFTNYTDHIVYKATILNDDPERIESLYREISEWPELTVTRTGTKRFDINAENVSKKTALMYLCSHKGIKREETAAAGDYDNDSEMIKWAGLGIAMGNGNHLIKEIADVITKSNEEHGVAELIKTYFES